MGVMFSINIVLLLTVFFNLILRIWTVGLGRLELPEEGKETAIWGRIILAAIGIIGVFIFYATGAADQPAMKWFWMLFMLAAIGFQAFLDWRYLKGTKNYIVTLTTLVFWEVLAYLLV